MRAHEFDQPGAAGCIIVAEDTGRWCFQQRSDSVSDPGVWAAWGGGREPGESVEQTVRRELAEEGGYRGPIKLEHLHTSPRYITFIGRVPHEFEPRLNYESKDYCWTDLDKLPEPMHPGVTAALKNIPVKQNVAEAFDQPYPMTWEHGDESHDALVKLPDGSNLSIMFSMDYGAYGDEEWTVEFWRNNSQEVTGEGDQQRIFATVLSAIQQFIKTEHPERIRFSANKAVEPGQKSQTRSNLYTKLVQRYANSWGYGVDIDDFADTTVYNLHTLTENFADGKVKGKSRPGRVKRAGASCKGSVSNLRARAKRSGGESVTEAKHSDVIYIGNDVAIIGQEHGKRLQLSDQDIKRVQAIAQQHGAWYEGNGMDRKLTKGIIDDYQGSWDDDLLSPAIKGYPAPFLYVLFSNIKENDTVEGKIGFEPSVSIFDRILGTQPSTNYFPYRRFDAETLRKFLRAVSEGEHDFLQMSQAPATERNVRKFFELGEQLMWPNNWEEYPNRAGRVAKSVNDLRDRFLATRKKGVYVAGSDHLQAVQQFLDQDKQGVSENFADGKIKGKSRPGRVKRAGASCKGSVTDLRAKARKYGGERGRMYHWCANMKGGKKK